MEAATGHGESAEHLRSTKAPLAWQIALASLAAIAIASFAAYALGFRPGVLVQDLHRSSIGNRFEAQCEPIAWVTVRCLLVAALAQAVPAATMIWVGIGAVLVELAVILPARLGRDLDSAAT